MKNARSPRPNLELVEHPKTARLAELLLCVHSRADSRADNLLIAGRERTWARSVLTEARAYEAPFALPCAVGVLSLLWSWAAQYRPTGSLERLGDVSIADVCRCRRADARRLVSALRDAGWIDMEPFQRLHDWSHHAAPSVHARLAARGKLFCDGVVPSVALLHASKRAEALRRLAEARRVYEAGRGELGNVLRFEARV